MSEATRTERDKTAEEARHFLEQYPARFTLGLDVKAACPAAFALPGQARPFDRYGLPRIGIWRRDGAARVLLKTTAARRPIGALRRWS